MVDLRRLNTGKSIDRSFENSPYLAIDGSDGSLRNYSPFTIRIVPPSVLGANIASGGPNDPYSIRNLQIPPGLVITGSPALSDQSYGEYITRRRAEDGTIEEVVTQLRTPPEFIQQFGNYGQTGRYLDERNDERGHRHHGGVDLYFATGSPIYAPFDGEVLYSRPLIVNGDDQGQQIAVRSSQDESIVVRILHVNESSVNRGDTVIQGQQIAVSFLEPRFPRGSESHVHLEASTDGTPRVSGTDDPFAVFDVSRLYSTSPVVGSQEGTETIAVPTDTSQISTIGIYSAASSAINSRDLYDSFARQLSQGKYANLTNRQLQTLQAYVSNGTISRPSIDNRSQSPAVLNDAITADLVAQISAMVDTPAIQLLINPQELTVQKTKLLQFSERTRAGYVLQNFGQELDVLSISGRTGAFISGASSQAVGSRGVQFASSRDSAAFQNLMDIFAVYANNACVYDNITGSKQPVMIGTIAIDYDGFTYVGHFNSFQYSYDEENPNGGITFEMEFKVLRTFYPENNGASITGLNQPVSNTLPYSPVASSFFDPSVDTDSDLEETDFLRYLFL